MNESGLAGGDAADGPAEAIQPFAGDTFNGPLGVQADRDWFRVEYEAGVACTVTLTPGTLVTPFIHIFDATGALLQVVDTAFDGGMGHDTLIGGAGHDRLWGNEQADIFVFGDGHGRDTIEDFDASSRLEKIDLSGISSLSGIEDFDAFMGLGAVRIVSGGVLVTTGEAMSILLAGVLLDDLGADHFVF